MQAAEPEAKPPQRISLALKAQPGHAAAPNTPGSTTTDPTSAAAPLQPASDPPWALKPSSQAPIGPIQQLRPDFLIRPQMRQNSAVKAEPGTSAAEVDSDAPEAVTAARSSDMRPREAGPAQQQGSVAAAENAVADDEAVKARRRR